MRVNTAKRFSRSSGQRSSTGARIFFRGWANYGSGDESPPAGSRDPDIDQEFEFYEFFLFLKFNEFYKFFFG